MEADLPKQEPTKTTDVAEDIIARVDAAIDRAQRLTKRLQAIEAELSILMEELRQKESPNHDSIGKLKA